MRRGSNALDPHKPSPDEEPQHRQKTRSLCKDFAVHASVYGKVQAGPTPTSDVQERRRRKGGFPLPELGCLATYIGYVSRVST